MQVAGSIALVVALVAMSHAGAQSTHPLSHHVAQSSTTAAAKSELVDGEVRKVDKEAGKITLKHAELKSLDMPPMTMVFQVQDKALLDKVKTGDKVRFAAAKIGGQLTVTAIELGR